MEQILDEIQDQQNEVILRVKLENSVEEANHMCKEKEEIKDEAEVKHQNLKRSSKI